MSTYKRRVYITTRGQFHGMATEVRDMETDRVIPGIARIRIDIDPRKVNEAHLLCYRLDDKDQFILEDGKPILEEKIIEEVIIEMNAMEPLKRSDIEQLFREALRSPLKQDYLWKIADALRLDLGFDVPSRYEDR